MANSDVMVFHLETALADSAGQVGCQLYILFVNIIPLDIPIYVLQACNCTLRRLELK
jgi:hypothetical protein